MEGTDEEVGAILAHFGVKGMKWGQRLAARKARKAETSEDAGKSLSVRDKAKTHSVKALTNAQLKTALERMNLEQNFKRAANNEKSAVSRYLANMLADIGKRELTSGVNASISGYKAKRNAAKSAATVVTRLAIGA